jgi:hypothetical protein
MSTTTHRHDDPDLPCHLEGTALVCDLCDEVIDGCDPHAPDRFGHVASPSDDPA